MTNIPRPDEPSREEFLKLAQLYDAKLGEADYETETLGVLIELCREQWRAGYDAAESRLATATALLCTLSIQTGHMLRQLCKPADDRGEFAVERVQTVQDVISHVNEFLRLGKGGDASEENEKRAEALRAESREGDGKPEGTREALERCAKMLDTYGPECFPANDKGQIHFARAMMESTVDEIRAFLSNPVQQEK